MRSDIMAESGRKRWENGEDEMEYRIVLPEDMEDLAAAMKKRIWTSPGTKVGPTRRL